MERGTGRERGAGSRDSDKARSLGIGNPRVRTNRMHRSVENRQRPGEGTRFRPVMANERGVAGRAETRINRSVRRCLFQDDDRDEHSSGEEDNYRNSLLEGRRRSSENARQRWNFDFEKEEPLPGRYEWVRVDQNGREVPDSQVQAKSVGAGGARLPDHADVELEDNKMTENEDAVDKPEQTPSTENNAGCT